MRPSHGLYCFLTRDGTAAEAECNPANGLTVTLATGERFLSRKLLLATGVCDKLPAIPGFEELDGLSVFHCPYCDGWELRDQPLAICGRGARGFGLALELTAWSRDLVLCTDGPPEIEPADLDRLHRHGITVREERVRALESEAGVLSRIVFDGGPPLPRRALFFTTGQYQRSDLLERMGCEFNDKGTVRTGQYEKTHLPGLFVAGDASRAYGEQGDFFEFAEAFSLHVRVESVHSCQSPASMVIPVCLPAVPSISSRL